MTQVDILIVGGGPAGSSLAWALRDTRLRIAIMDKREFPRDKVCAGWVTPAVMDTLQIDLDDYRQSRTLQPISGFRVSQLGQKQVETHYQDEPVSYGIRRREFDEYLLRRSGAELMLGQAFKTMERDGESWLINGEIRASLVIGAGGHFCPVARRIGAKLGSSEQVVAAQEIEFEMSEEQKAGCHAEPEVPELFFTPDLKGYGWIFRKGDYLNVGLGREENHRLSEHVRDFCNFLRESGRLDFDITDKFQGHAYLLYPHALRQVVDEGVLLIGDAAGLAYPQSGEGIRPAIESALLAAQVIREAAGEYSKDKLQPYQQMLEQRFGERQPTPSLLERLPLGIKQVLASRLMQTHWFTRKVVIDRWFLQSHQPQLQQFMPVSKN
ncbi:MAG: NAD(P)/FAD-dependent oxidoreductase [Thiohalophilus sp.]|uniref:NAD(P)/FAD-dependent oxidoreductase n=1 Tax=Thiohalophilus sp. TaxID=3028392 RepID=UPI0028707A7F|nr:NAD(P)/FAD-dependent oxidoreductase [Thiohalophilus sp.]MDR9435977.1 NAD(P)/FAD-dependent oxidoreductase [Thiohalophilus sp.]